MRIRTLPLAILMGLFTAAHAAPPDAAIEKVLDRGKGRIYAKYTRALQERPELQGRVDLEFTVAKDGKASGCRVAYSELGHPPLEKQLCETIESMPFESRQAPITVVKKLEFFPAGSASR